MYININHLYLYMTAINTIKLVDNYYNNSYKKSYSFKHRLNETNEIKIKYPHRIPVICEKHYENTMLDNLPKKNILFQWIYQ